jgi:hypothetical protein
VEGERGRGRERGRAGARRPGRPALRRRHVCGRRGPVRLLPSPSVPCADMGRGLRGALQKAAGSPPPPHPAPPHLRTHVALGSGSPEQERLFGAGVALRSRGGSSEQGWLFGAGERLDRPFPPRRRSRRQPPLGAAAAANRAAPRIPQARAGDFMGKIGQLCDLRAAEILAAGAGAALARFGTPAGAESADRPREEPGRAPGSGFEAPGLGPVCAGACGLAGLAGRGGAMPPLALSARASGPVPLPSPLPVRAGWIGRVPAVRRRPSGAGPSRLVTFFEQ